MILIIIVLFTVTVENLYNKILSEIIIDKKYLYMNYFSIFWIYNIVSSIVYLIAMLLHFFIISADILTHFLTALKYLDELTQCKNEWIQQQWLLHFAEFLKLVLHILLNNDLTLLNADDHMLVSEMIMKILHCVCILSADEHLVFNLMINYVVIYIIHEFVSCFTLQLILILWDSTDFHCEYVWFVFFQLSLYVYSVL